MSLLRNLRFDVSVCSSSSSFPARLPSTKPAALVQTQHHHRRFVTAAPHIRRAPTLTFLLAAPRQRLQSTVAQPPKASTTSSPPPPRRRRSLFYRIPLYIAAGTLSLIAGIVIMAADALPVAAQILRPPTDAETLALWQPDPNTRAGELEAQLQAHPLVAALRADATLSESRPHMRIPAEMRGHNFTGGTLLGSEMLEVPALVFAARDGSRMVSVHYVGAALCGHPGIVHGGLLATLLDEGLARCCFPALPNRIAVTASLNVAFKAPCYADQFIVLRAETTKVDGRKAWVKGRLETLVDEEKGETPLLLDEAEALFIEPKGAKHMAKIYTEPVE
ncbi:HotDog domain-containing protein [Phyllosticta capitalensis]|uniref:HotDog domain-containing protein n=1 Tax=Phyllosticta capitalensis TaxID=121624 RepID=A0ABR1YUK9_9PEZI